MTDNTKTLLIVAGLAVVGYLVYKKYGSTLKNAPTSITHQGSGNSVPTATNQGSTNGSVSSIANQVGGDINSVDNTFNSIYNWFTNPSGTATTPTNADPGTGAGNG